MTNLKKLSIYDLNIKYFKDEDNDGIGDLKGLLSKMDYFSFLNIDSIILQEILSTDTKEEFQNFTTISKQLGTIEDFKKIIAKAKKINLKIFIELNLGFIKEENDWFKEYDNKNKIINFQKKHSDIEGLSKFNIANNEYFPINKKTKEIPLNWNDKNVSEKFIKVIKFWNKIGVNGFVFKEFEWIKSNFNEEAISNKTIFELRKFYSSIKNIDDKIILIGKSKIIDYKDSKKMTYGNIKIFDYFMCSKISLLGTHKKFGNDLISYFWPHMLNNILKQIALDPSNILSFGNEFSGRINSRWGDEGQYNKEAAKTICILNLMTKASFSIYYSDELGAKNIGLKKIEDFKEKDLNLRILKLKDLGIKDEKILFSQIKQNRINAKSLMLWNSGKNAGFSNANKTIVPASMGYQNNNVTIQFNDKFSILNFYKTINTWIKQKEINEIIEKGELIISNYFLNLGIIKYEYKLHNKELMIISNLSLSRKRLLFKPKLHLVIFSSYSKKEYFDIPNWLESYETIVTINKIKEEENIKNEKIIKAQNIILPKKILKSKNLEEKNDYKGHNESKTKIEEKHKTNLKEEEIAFTREMDLDNIDKIEDNTN